MDILVNIQMYFIFPVLNQTYDQYLLYNLRRHPHKHTQDLLSATFILGSKRNSKKLRRQETLKRFAKNMIVSHI